MKVCQCGIIMVNFDVHMVWYMFISKIKLLLVALEKPRSKHTKMKFLKSKPTTKSSRINHKGYLPCPIEGMNAFPLLQELK